METRPAPGPVPVASIRPGDAVTLAPGAPAARVVRAGVTAAGIRVTVREPGAILRTRELPAGAWVTLIERAPAPVVGGA